MARVMTAPLAIIKSKDGKAIGKMKNIRVTETFRRGRVSGLGMLTPDELPLLEWNGTLTCQFYMIDLARTGIPGLVNRRAQSVQEFIDTVLLNEEGVDIYIYRKGSKTIDQETGNVVATVENDFAVIRGGFLDREAFSIDEGQISGQDQDMTYKNPILYSVG